MQIHWQPSTRIQANKVKKIKLEEFKEFWRRKYVDPKRDEQKKKKVKVKENEQIEEVKNKYKEFLTSKSEALKKIAYGMDAPKKHHVSHKKLKRQKHSKSVQKEHTSNPVRTKVDIKAIK